MTKAIYFDMDGTVYDLYGVPKWLDRIETEDATVFSEGKPLVDMDALNEACLNLIVNGYKIGVITWAPMGASFEYIQAVSLVKYKWIQKYMPYVQEFFVQEYGTPKQYAINKKSQQMILIDDNKDIRERWNTAKQRKSIDANEDILKALQSLLEEI